ncbi:bacteriocin immunity protein [Lactobacillus kalixensis]|nr:bacteriocin immunity protein [Lactobacillus kalixensis]
MLVDQQKIYQDLKDLYSSFSDEMYSLLATDSYSRIRRAIGLVMQKFENNDHPLAYTGKLVMYIQAKVALNNLRLTSQQEQLIKSLTESTKRIHLSYVYLSPIDSSEQFV